MFYESPDDEPWPAGSRGVFSQKESPLKTLLAILACLCIACCVETAQAQCESGVCSLRPVANRAAEGLPRPGKRLVQLAKRLLPGR